MCPNCALLITPAPVDQIESRLPGKDFCAIPQFVRQGGKIRSAFLVTPAHSGALVTAEHLHVRHEGQRHCRTSMSHPDPISNRYPVLRQNLVRLELKQRRDPSRDPDGEPCGDALPGYRHPQTIDVARSHGRTRFGAEDGKRKEREGLWRAPAVVADRPAVLITPPGGRSGDAGHRLRESG